jgi:hypothetical protein
MGGKSSSSSATTSQTVTQDNRVAAADSAVAVGSGGQLDQSIQGVELNDSSNRSTNNIITADGAFDVADSAIWAGVQGTESVLDAFTTSNKQNQDTLREVFGKSIDFAGDTTSTGFDFLGGIAGEQYEFADDVLMSLTQGVDSAQEKSYGFAGNVLQGYEESRLEESERKFNQIVTAAIILGVAGLVAWAVVKG